MSKVIGIDMGHTLSGANYGAVALMRESEETRVLGKKVISYLESAGAKVVNCTIDKATSNASSLRGRVDKANAQKLDLFVSIHFNKTEGGYGSEIYTYKGFQQPEAINILKGLNSIGFTSSTGRSDSRGIKDGSHLYVVKRSKARAMLIEVCFVDSERDVKVYKNNIDKIAKVIAEGILSKSIDSALPSKPIVETPTKPIPSSPSSKPEKYDRKETIKLLQSELNSQGFANPKLVVDGVIGAKTLNACPTLKPGAKGGITKALQQMLIIKGMDIGTNSADGIFGSGTEGAIKRYQGQYKITVDGIVGKKTWEVVFK